MSVGPGERPFITTDDGLPELRARVTAVGALGPVVGVDGVQLIPRSLWREASISHAVGPIKNQDGLGYCHSYAGAKCEEMARVLSGSPFIALSGTGLGSIVTGSVNRGAALDEVLPVLLGTGCPTEADVPEHDYRRKNWLAAWRQNAGQYKAIEVWDCGHDDVFDAICTLIQLGVPVELGCSKPWGPHAVVASQLIRDGSRWKLRGAGSWGPTAHDGDGFWTVAESGFSGLDVFGAFGIRVATRQEA